MAPFSLLGGRLRYALRNMVRPLVPKRACGRTGCIRWNRDASHRFALDRLDRTSPRRVVAQPSCLREALCLDGDGCGTECVDLCDFARASSRHIQSSMDGLDCRDRLLCEHLLEFGRGGVACVDAWGRAGQPPRPVLRRPPAFLGYRHHRGEFARLAFGRLAAGRSLYRLCSARRTRGILGLDFTRPSGLCSIFAPLIGGVL